MKFSRQREIILKYVKSFPVHPTADQVYTALKKENPGLSLGTVYRNLNQLSEIGMLKKIYIADGSDRFDGRTDTHFHMICEDCGRVFDIETPELEEIISRIRQREGHEITGVTLNLRGICAECSVKEKAE
ncbi:MAG: transcriptional repressor [Oscillospiraceae bacterium]|nr:transcriptional repressor [Oscillospiraceae bacterium]